jgi:hypothetical protein
VVTDEIPGEYEAMKTLEGSFRAAREDHRDGHASVYYDGQWTTWAWQWRCLCNLAIATACHANAEDARRIADERLAREWANEWHHTRRCPCPLT